MAGLPARTRKRDKIRDWLGSSRSISQDGSQIPSSSSSITPPAQAQTTQTRTLPSSSSNQAAFESHSAPSPSSSITPSTTIAAPVQATLASSSIPTTSAPDLWSDALETLSEDDQQTIRKIQPAMATRQPLPNAMNDLISMTKAKQHECEEKSYKFRFQGKEIILRDVAGKIVFWLNKFKDIGDIGVNFDPVHAGLPWAGVRFLLQVLRTFSSKEILLKTMKGSRIRT
jgi:ankyrin repeat domain-containing protein 50